MQQDTNTKVDQKRLLILCLSRTEHDGSQTFEAARANDREQQQEQEQEQEQGQEQH